jgi:hypothetical protein
LVGFGARVVVGACAGAEVLVALLVVVRAAVVVVAGGCGARGAGVSRIETTIAGTGMFASTVVPGGVVEVVVVVDVLAVLAVVVVVVIGSDSVEFTELSSPAHPLVPGVSASIAKFSSTILAVPTVDS